jgi:hypothetical protein
MAPKASRGTPRNTGPVNAFIWAEAVAGVGASPGVAASSFASVRTSWNIWTPLLRVTPRASSGRNQLLNARTCHAVMSSGASASALMLNARNCHRG